MISTIIHRQFATLAAIVLMAATLFSAAVQAQSADLQILKTGPAEVLPTANFAWTLQIVNAGPGAANGATFSDPIPQGVINVSASCTAAGGAVCGAVNVASGPLNYLVSGTISVLPPGASVTIVISATAPSLVATLVPIFPPMVNVATVAPPSGVVDPNPSNNQAQATTRVRQADLIVTKSHAGSFRQGQQGATYTLVVTNIGVLPHFGMVFVDDTLPAGLTATAISGAGWNCTLAPLQCISSTTIPPGASLPPITLTVDVAANAPGSLVNVAHVDGLQNSVTGNDTSLDPTVISYVGPIPALSTIGLAALSIALAASVAFRRRPREGHRVRRRE